MQVRKYLVILLLFALLLSLSEDVEARRRRRKRYSGPPPTHPVVLWAKTLAESTDREQRKVAAFKLSQYSQRIFQESVIDTVIRCMKDPDVQIRVLCAKGLGRAGTQGHTERIRKVLLDHYASDPTLRNTIVRALITRNDNSQTVHDTVLDHLRKSSDLEEIATHLSYLELHGSGNNKFVETLTEIYKKSDNSKIKTSVVKALGARAEGQDAVISLLSQCVQNKEDTPLILNCLAALQQQARKDNRVWLAVENTIDSDDPDVLVATLDVINALPETPNSKVAGRLVDLISELEDSDTQEKAIFALGISGDRNEAIVNSLTKLLEQKESDEGVRIAAALVLGKQAVSLPEKPKLLLSKCATGEKSQLLKNACQLGLNDLENRK